jgi:hypothetical protein
MGAARPLAFLPVVCFHNATVTTADRGSDQCGTCQSGDERRLADLGGTILPSSAADFGKLITNETEKWGKVIRAANIKPE